MGSRSDRLVIIGRINMNSEVLIIGGGIMGFAIARELRHRGVQDITLVERRSAGLESSWAAAGMLGPQAEADRNDAFFRFCCDSRDLYPKFADDLTLETGIDIELDKSGTLYLSFNESDERRLRKRFEWQRAAGLPVEQLSAKEARRCEPFVSPDVREALFFPDDWQVENRKLLAALRRSGEINGVNIVENTTVDRLTVENKNVVGAESGEQRFSAALTILTTGAWTSLIKIGVAEMPFSVEPVRGQMVVLKTAKRLFQRVIYSHRGYLVPRVDGRILAGSTTERKGFDCSVTEQATNILREMSNEIAPTTSGLPTVDRWAGLRPFTFDGLPIIGGIETIGGLTIATAHYRNGILLAPITAARVADSMLNGETPDPAYSPDRFRLRSVVSGI